MKKTLKIAAVAIIASLTIVSCKNNAPSEQNNDTTAIEQVAEELNEECNEAIDTVVAAVEQTATTVANTTKKAATNTAKKVEQKVDDGKMKIQEVKASSEKVAQSLPDVTSEDISNAKVVTTRRRR